MGMTIDECVKMLIAKEKCIERETSGTDTDCNYHNCDKCSLCYEQGNMGEQKEALRFAVDTMRKYQRIAQIVEGWNADPEMDSADSMSDIKGVIDGNNNH